MNNFAYHPSKNKSVKNVGKSKFVTQSGYIDLMCPECFHMEETYVSNKTIVLNNFSKNEFCVTDHKYFGTCPNCKECVEFIPIDINMGKIINILNDKGYYTAFCCEGHIEPDDYDGRKSFKAPMIVFYLWEDIDILKLIPLPDSWCLDPLDKECEIFSICDIISESCPKYFKDETDYDEYIKWIEENWNPEKSIEDIYAWASALPYKDEVTKKYEYSFIKKYGETICEMNCDKRIFIMNK